jgi:hypothetical protein
LSDRDIESLAEGELPERSRSVEAEVIGREEHEWYVLEVLVLDLCTGRGRESDGCRATTGAPLARGVSACGTKNVVLRRFGAICLRPVAGRRRSGRGGLGEPRSSRGLAYSAVDNPNGFAFAARHRPAP